MSYTNRDEIPAKYKWDLTPLMEEDHWEVEFNETMGALPKVAEFKGKLGDKATLKAFFDLSDDIELHFERLYVYANLRMHEDAKIAKFREMVARISMAAAELGGAFAWVNPEIIATYSEKELLALADDPDFFAHRHSLQEMARQKNHVLSDKEEKLLAQVSSVLGGYQDTFGVFDAVDIKYQPVTVDGKKVALSHGKYGELMLSKDRNVRRQAHISMMKGYGDMINTLASNYSGNVQGDVFYARARGYNSCLEKALDADNIPVKVYDNLLSGVHRAIPTLKRYLAYRKDKLGIGQHRAYDMYAITEDAGQKKYDVEESFAMVLEGLAPLGEDYVALLRKAINERWIDVYETPGKRAGGYSWGVYGSPAYILLNYNGTLSETFTIAHELGHSMHTYHSDKALPYAAAGYRIFVAEIASTVNEMLLIKSLLKKASPEEKKYLLSYQLDMFKSTVFRQTLFAEFEKEAHEVVEKGGGLDANTLNKIYEDLNVRYYGKQFITPYIKYEWAR
ncbi:MAG: oligoendopeptidase F family protein, partial [Clostridia bacterium]|nr:oligoendopeptidase F family protein [Clostridia bacterium]